MNGWKINRCATSTSKTAERIAATKRGSPAQAVSESRNARQGVCLGWDPGTDEAATLQLRHEHTGSPLPTTQSLRRLQFPLVAPQAPPPDFLLKDFPPLPDRYGGVAVPLADGTTTTHYS